MTSNWGEDDFDTRTLIAVSIQGKKPDIWYPGLPEQPYKFVIHGESSETDANFTFETGALIGELKQNCLDLEAHGFTVVEVPRNWRWVYSDKPGGWPVAAMELAAIRIKPIFACTQGKHTVASYDEKLADAALKIIDDAFPHPLQNIEIKHKLSEEPSDEALLTALDALLLQGFVTGVPIRGHTSGKRRLEALANIQITAEGHRRAAGHTQAPEVAPTIHQFVNYGQAGAMGHQAVGTINYQSQWNELAANGTDFHVLAAELEKLRKHIQQNATSRSDFQLMGLLANAEEEAEQKNGTKLMETLSRAGKAALGVAKEIGTDIAAKVIAKATGLEP